jgi:uncharacterized membrane protein YgcG
MKFFKLSLITFTAATFLIGCSSGQIDQASSVNPYPTGVAESQINEENPYWAKENLDLQAVGALLEKADNAEEFEYLLNSEDGVNNLDLNGDGYVDYISVREYDDRDDDQRGFSLFSMFGPNEIQEIVTILFNRQGSNYPGSRVLLTGNEQLYGDNNYYETNWLDRALPIVSWLFNKDRNDVYQSPYYYENYPDYYEAYPVVETPVYRTRITQYYPTPVFIQTNAPTITQIKIKSPNNGKWINKIYSKLAKPNKEQVEFRKNNPNKPEFVRIKNEKPKNVKVKFDDKPNKFDDRPKGNPNKFDKPNKIEKVNQPNPVKVEKQNNKFEKQNNNPQKSQGNPNGKGNNGGGKGGGNKGGGGKGGGKKG